MGWGEAMGTAWMRWMDEYGELGRKNRDYGGREDDFLANFRDVAERKGDTVAGVLFVYVASKFSRLSTHVRNGFYDVPEESVLNEIGDLRNYLMLMALAYEEKKQNDERAA